MSLPPPTTPMSTSGNPEQVLRRLDLLISRRLDGLLHGDYHGLVPGHGSELGETREYQAGRRRPPHRLERHRPAPAAPRPRDDRRPRARDVAARSTCPRRSTSAPRCARSATWPSRPRRPSGSSPPAPATASARCCSSPDGPVTVPARGGKDHLMALLHRILTAPRPERGTTAFADGIRRLAVSVPPPGPGRRRLGLPGRRRLAPAAPPARRPPRDPLRRGRRSPRARAPRGRRAPARRPPDRRPRRDPDLEPAAARALRGRGRRAAGRHRRRHPAAPAPSTSSCAPTGTGCSTSSASSPAAGTASGAGPGRWSRDRADLPRTEPAVAHAGRARAGGAPTSGSRCAAASTRCASPTSSCCGASPRRRPGWRRHLPAIALVLGLACMVVALARPAREEKVPRERATVILAIDTSLSMMATDVAPNRIDAAKKAAKVFLDIIPPKINVGLVSFNGVGHRQRAAHDRPAGRQAAPSTASSWRRRPPSARRSTAASKRSSSPRRPRTTRRRCRPASC